MIEPAANQDDVIHKLHSVNAAAGAALLYGASVTQIRKAVEAGMREMMALPAYGHQVPVEKQLQDHQMLGL